MSGLCRSGALRAIGAALMLASCALKSNLDRSHEIASACGMPDLRLKTDSESGVVLVDEPRVSYEPDNDSRFPSQTRQEKVFKAFYSCIFPKAKQEGIKIDYRFRGFVD